MGKITVLMVLLIAVLLPFILTSGYSRSQQLPEAIKEEIVHNEVRNLGNYALTYAINRISTYEVDINPGVQTETFNNFNVLNGTINQITYDVTADQDTIRIQADITCQIDQNLVNHTSRAEVSYSPFFCTPQGVDNAITSTGLIEIKGSAEVDGNIEEQAILDFEEIFGYTKGQIRNGATHHYIDPENNILPVDNVTWVDLVDDIEAIISSDTWAGSGLFIIDGDLKITGGFFYGILWVTGKLTITAGNPHIEGAIFVEGVSEIDKTKITGNPIINFNSDAVTQSFKLYLASADLVEVLSWFE